MPYLVNADLITFEDGEITQPREPLQKDRCSILGGEYCSLYNLTPGCISKLRIKNLIYGENLASVLRENRVLPTKGCDLLDMDVSDKAVVDILDAVVALPLRPPSFEIHFEEKRTKSLREAIVDKFKDAADFHGALTFNLITVSTCKNQISFSFANALS
uniref:Recep_L_domain domain-containing protein n=1 Tax=Panagrellus redivivus TaxID=6233 RepID=A0A7E4W669_PANRE